MTSRLTDAERAAALREYARKLATLRPGDAR